jgi:hypothetical protein
MGKDVSNMYRMLWQFMGRKNYQNTQLEEVNGVISVVCSENSRRIECE